MRHGTTCVVTADSEVHRAASLLRYPPRSIPLVSPAGARHPLLQQGGALRSIIAYCITCASPRSARAPRARAPCVHSRIGPCLTT